LPCAIIANGANAVAERTKRSTNEEAAGIQVRREDHIGRWRRIVHPDRSRDADPDGDCCLRTLRPEQGHQAKEGGEGPE
jgi:hypothetical protein